MMASPVQAGPMMAASDQTTLVHQHCAVCHSEAHMNGGMSLTDYDAAHPDPGLAAMLASKITGGLPMATVKAAASDSAAAALLAKKMDHGALRAAGRAMPDAGAQMLLIATLSRQADGADGWTVHRTPDAAGVVTVSTVREVSSPTVAGQAESYRLSLACHAGGGEGTILLAWANATPKPGQVISVAADDAAPFDIAIEDGEKKFPGAFGTSGTGGMYLTGASGGGLGLPRHRLAVRNVFPEESVSFRLDGLDRATRAALEPCFGSRANR